LGHEFVESRYSGEDLEEVCVSFGPARVLENGTVDEMA
jgi:hypothetical protein